MVRYIYLGIIKQNTSNMELFKYIALKISEGEIMWGLTEQQDPYVYQLWEVLKENVARN